MSESKLANVADQIQKFWSPVFTKELREKTLLPGLVSKDYDGEIKQAGDTVYVSQINAPTGETRTVGVDADTFTSQALSTSRISVVADKRFVASFEVEDLVSLQSQITAENSDIRTSLLFSIEKQLNNYLYGLVSPSTSAPDHLLNSITDMNKAQLSAIRLLAAQAKWDKMKPWIGLVDPSYYTDIMNDTSLGSKDYGAEDAPLINGRVSLPRMGFNLIEDDSRSADKGLFFHPDFLHLVLQQQVRFKLSDLHSNNKFAYLLSVDMVGGAALGIAGNKKHIWATAAASGIGANS